MYIRLRQLLLTFITGTLWLPSALEADEVTLETGQSFGLRISGVPAEDVALVSGKFSISDAGTVSFPYLKAGLKASGLKPSALARKIEAAYRQAEIYSAPTIQIDGEGKKGDRFVSVLGEVRNPQTLVYVSGMTILDAVAQCGGFTDFAKESKIKLTRSGKFTFHDLSRGSTKENVRLLPGDIVTVR